MSLSRDGAAKACWVELSKQICSHTMTHQTTPHQTRLDHITPSTLTQNAPSHTLAFSRKMKRLRTERHQKMPLSTCCRGTQANACTPALQDVSNQAKSARNKGLGGTKIEGTKIEGRKIEAEHAAILSNFVMFSCRAHV